MTILQSHEHLIKLDFLLGISTDTDRDGVSSKCSQKAQLRSRYRYRTLLLGIRI